MIPRHAALAAILALAFVACDDSAHTPAMADATHADARTASVTTLTDAGKAALAALATEYRGTVGAGRPAIARLFHDGNRVAGSYFFEAAGDALVLGGSVSGARLALDETLDKVKSGSLVLDVGPDGTLNGTWTDAHGGSTVPVHLEPIVQATRPTSALLFKRRLQATKPASSPKSANDACKTTVAYPEVYGLPPVVEARINAELQPAPEVSPPERCDHAVEIVGDYRIADNADGILSVRITSTVTDSQAPAPTRRGKAVTLLIGSGERVKLFGDVVKLKSERVFEAALNQQIEAAAKKGSFDANGRKALDQALAFSPPFVLEDKGVRLFADSLPPPYSAVGAEGVLVRYAVLPRPFGAAAPLWGK